VLTCALLFEVMSQIIGQLNPQGHDTVLLKPR
jgi:hypothetical protein